MSSAGRCGSAVCGWGYLDTLFGVEAARALVIQPVSANCGEIAALAVAGRKTCRGVREFVDQFEPLCG